MIKVNEYNYADSNIRSFRNCTSQNKVNHSPQSCMEFSI